METDIDWSVDDRCTNCDVARQLAPGLIGEVDGKSKVLHQPGNLAEELMLYAAAYACPSRSIRRSRGRLESELDPFPLRLDESVFLCGHNSPHNAGANSYLLTRPGGNLMMVDTPRWSEPLAARYEQLGPITDVLLTHRDHAAHGRRYADRFSARLWIHEGDLDASPDADQVIRGRDPVDVGDGVIGWPLPGHTEGSVVFVADELYAFTGDSVYWSRALADLTVAESVTWYSMEVLARSLAESVGRFRFSWLLPGHGDRQRLPSAEMDMRWRRLAERAASVPSQPIDFTAVRW